MNNIIALFLLHAAIVVNAEPLLIISEDNSQELIQSRITDLGDFIKYVFAYLEPKEIIRIGSADKSMKAVVDKWTIKPSKEMISSCPKEWNNDIIGAPSKQPFSYSHKFDVDY